MKPDGSYRKLRWKQEVGGSYQASFSEQDERAIQAAFRSAVAEARDVGSVWL